MRKKLLTNSLLVSVFLLFNAMCCEPFENDYYNEKRLLKEIELVSIDNSGRIGVESDTAIKKEAYVIGINFKIEMDSIYNDNPNNYPYYHRKLNNIDLSEPPIVICNNDFNAEYPTGSNVSKFFTYTVSLKSNKRCDKYLVLRTAPDPGTHSFTVRYNCTDSTIVEKTTLPVELY